jgi:hypothetical protein
LLKKDRGSTKRYQLRIKSNDIITMVLNSTIGSLSYYVNDVNYGVAFLDARLKDTLVRPAFSCRLKYCSTQLIIRINQMNSHYDTNYYKSYENILKDTQKVLGNDNNDKKNYFVNILNRKSGDMTAAIACILAERKELKTEEKIDENEDEFLESMKDMLFKQRTLSQTNYREYPQGLILKRDMYKMNEKAINSITNDTNTNNEDDHHRISNLFLPSLCGPFNMRKIALYSQIMFTSKTIIVHSLRNVFMKIMLLNNKTNNIDIKLKQLGGMRTLRQLLLIIAPRRSIKNEYFFMNGISGNATMYESLNTMRPLLLSILNNHVQTNYFKLFLLSECVNHLISASHPTITTTQERIVKKTTDDKGVERDKSDFYNYNDRTALTTPNIRFVNYLLCLLWEAEKRNHDNANHDSSSSSSSSSRGMKNKIWSNNEIKMILNSLHVYIQSTDGFTRIDGIHLLISFLEEIHAFEKYYHDNTSTSNSRKRRHWTINYALSPYILD